MSLLSSVPASTKTDEALSRAASDATLQQSCVQLTCFPALLLMLGTFLLFAQSIPFDFINFDDGPYVYRNRHVTAGLTWHGVEWAFTSLNADTSYWHPLTWLSHMVDVQVFGLNAPGHRLGNILLHTVNSGILFTLLRRFGLSVVKSWFIGAFFAWHPLRVESVVWIAERKDVLCAFFYLLSLRKYMDYLRSRRGLDLAITYTAFGLGAMTKPMIVSLPLVLIVIDCWYHFGQNPAVRPSVAVARQIGRSIIQHSPLLVLSCMLSGITVLAQWNLGTLAPLDRISLSERLLTVIFGYGHYVQRLFWPSSLNILQLSPDTWTIRLLAAPVLSVTILIVVLFRHRNPLSIAGILVYAVTLLPVSGLVQVGGQLVADRYSYLPSVGLLLVIGGLALPNSLPLRWSAHLGLVASLLVMVAATCLQIGHWRSSETVWRRALSVDPSNPIARNNLGMFFLEKRAYREAEAEFRSSLAQGPWQLRPHINLGDTLLQLREFNAAETAYRRGFLFHPRDALLRQGLGMALIEQGDLLAAAKQLRIALAADPNLAYPYYGLSRIALAETARSTNRSAEARQLAARSCHLSAHRDPRLLAHYARTIALDGDSELAHRISLAALRQFEGDRRSVIGKEIMEVLAICRVSPTNTQRSIHREPDH